MFSAQYGAKLRAASLSVRRIKGGDHLKSCEVTLDYPFTEKIAHSIGGDAIVIQEMLSRGDVDQMSRLSAGSLVLDCRDAKIAMKKGDNDKVEIEQTTSLTAKAKRPDAEAPAPTLEVKAKFDLDGTIMAFLWNHLDDVIKVRMDRRQLELVPDGEEKTEE